MKKRLVLFLALILMVPTFSFSRIFTFKAGLFIPRAKSDLWQVEFDNMDFKRSTYQNTNFGFAYEHFLTRQISVALGVDGYTKNKLGTYKSYFERVGESTIDGIEYYYATDLKEGDALIHVFNVSITPIQLSLKLAPLGRGRKLIPYFGGGVGVYLWSLTRQGDLIDFDAQQEYIDLVSGESVLGFPILIEDSRENNKFTVGYHAFGGFMIAFTNRMTLETEFKYNIIEGKLSDGNFRDYARFDLSGYQVSLGLNYWF